MKISHNGESFIKSYENLKLNAYPDPKTGSKPWTIGWGHTGPDVHIGLAWTREQADASFLTDIARFEDFVTLKCKSPLTQQRFDALVSWAYNCGIEKVVGATLWAKFNVGDYRGAADQLPRWCSPGTNVEAGLTIRRLAERDIFLNGHYVLHQ